MTKHSPEARVRAWTPQRRAAQAERMRKLNADDDLGGKRLAALRASTKAHRQRVKLGKSKRGIKMPESQRAFVAHHLWIINHDPAIRAKAAETRRVGPVPKGFVPRYRQLRDRIGPAAAMNIVRREAKMARVNQ